MGRADERDCQFRADCQSAPLIKIAGAAGELTQDVK
jgi:hypothetical protein